jgi:hypothetical protein
MRNAIAGLRRQAALAALACAVAMGVVSVVSRSAPFHAPAVEAFDRPILVKSVALDRTPIASQSMISYPSAVQQVSASPPAPAKATNPVARHNCAVTPCQRLAAALAPAPPRRPAMRLAPPTLETAALATPAHSEDKGARSLSDRLLWPVGAMRDRMVGLISSL